MCLSHLSESLLLDRLRYIVMLSSAYRNQPFVLFSQSATALANSTAIQELFKRTLVGVRLLRSGFEVTSLMSVCNFLVLSHVQETCILALVRNTCSMFRLDMILIDVGCYKVYWRRHGCYGVHGG